MRFLFGGGAADWTFVPDGDQVVVGDLTGEHAVIVGGVQVTLWSAETGGVQYADLLDTDENPIAAVVSEDGTTLRSLGQIPPFWGPDNVPELWAQAADGPRSLLLGRLGDAMLAVQQESGTTAAQFAAHSASANPHSTATHDLSDFSAAAPAAGQIPVWNATSGAWEPSSPAGLDPNAFVKVTGGSTIAVPNGNTTTVPQTIRIPAGDRTTAVNALEVYWNAGSDGSPDWRLVTSLSPYGELRAQPAATNRVALRIKQISGAQTANLTEWADFANVTKSWVDLDGRMRAPNLGITPSWAVDTATVVTGVYRWYNPTGTSLVLRGFVISCGGTVGAGGDLIINPKLDGVAVYASGNRPRLVAGSRYSGVATTLATTVWPAGSYLTVDVDVVPSTAPTKIHIQALAY